MSCRLHMSESYTLAFVSMPGGGEMMIIFLVALLLFGAKKLPELARGMGKAMGEFKAARKEFEDEIRKAEYEIKEEPKKIPRQSTVAPAVQSESSPASQAPAQDDASVS